MPALLTRMSQRPPCSLPTRCPNATTALYVGQITGEHEGLCAMLLNILFYLRQSCLIAGGEDHGGAHAREPMGDGLADAAGRSRDHRYLSH